MKIVYIVEPRKVIGGGVRAAMNLVKALRLYHNQEACIFGIYKGSVVEKAVRLVSVDTLNPLSASYWKSLHKFIQNERPDIVHCLGLYTALLSIMYKIIYRKDFKVVCTVHRVTMNMRYRRFIKLIVNFIGNKLDYVTFLTDYQRIHYFQNVHFRPVNYVVLPNVVFVEANEESEISSLKQELHSKINADYIFSYVGRIIPGKNIEFYLDVIESLNKRGVNAGGVLVGGVEKTYFEKLQNIIDKKYLNEKVVFIGYVNNPTLYIAASDFILFPTKSEALPNLLIESFAEEKIVFSSDIPQMQDLVDNGKNGFTYSTDNLEGFCEQIVSVVSDPIKISKIEKNAYNTYTSLYAPEVVTTQYYNIYKKL